MPPPVAGRPGGGGRGFDEIARERFNLRDDRVDIRVGRREGRFGQIRLSNVGGERFNVVEVIAEYGNGERQRVRLSERLEPGEQTRPIDLEGDQRFLRSVTVAMELSTELMVDIAAARIAAAKRPEPKPTRPAPAVVG